jgi:ketosteroid isomerase-like protein
MIEPQEARRIAQSWIGAFNAKDLARLLDHYAADVELISPVVSSFTGGRSDRLSGIAALRDYFATAFTVCPQLEFTLLDVSAGAGSLSIRYRSTLDDRLANECMELDGQGRAIRVLCHYSANEPQSSTCI